MGLQDVVGRLKAEEEALWESPEGVGSASGRQESWVPEPPPTLRQVVVAPEQLTTGEGERETSRKRLVAKIRTTSATLDKTMMTLLRWLLGR
jgi:hypothetical protein